MSSQDQIQEILVSSLKYVKSNSETFKKILEMNLDYRKLFSLDYSKIDDYNLKHVLEQINKEYYIQKKDSTNIITKYVKPVVLGIYNHLKKDYASTLLIKAGGTYFAFAFLYNNNKILNFAKKIGFNYTMSHYNIGIGLFQILVFNPIMCGKSIDEASMGKLSSLIGSLVNILFGCATMEK